MMPSYLHIGVERPEVDSLDLGFHHTLNGVAAPAADPNHLYTHIYIYIFSTHADKALAAKQRFERRQQ